MGRQTCVSDKNGQTHLSLVAKMRQSKKGQGEISHMVQFSYNFQHRQFVPVENALGRKTSDCLRSKTKIAGDYGCLDVSLLDEGFRIFLDGSRLQLLIISSSV